MTVYKTVYKLNKAGERPTLADLRDASLASHDAFTRAAASAGTGGMRQVLTNEAQEQSRIAGRITAHLTLESDANRTTGGDGTRAEVATMGGEVAPLTASHAPVMAVLLEAILESRRSYKLALTLARQELLSVRLVP